MAENINLCDADYLNRLLKKHGFTFSKSLGQNFIIDSSVCPKMAQLCGCENSGVIEIGPGVGVLTRELSGVAKKVVAIELDRRLLPIYSETLCGCDNVEVVFGDVMKLDLAALIKEHFGGMNVVVCANLPYYITSPIIMGLLEQRLPLESITVMVQKEAADRLCAEMGTRECGAVTAAVSYYAAAEILFDVPRECFMPSPKVDSSVIRLNLHKEPPVSVNDEKYMFKIIRSAFNQRRKTLCNSLNSAMGLEKPIILSALETCGLKPTARPEELTLAQFAKLSDTLGKL